MGLGDGDAATRAGLEPGSMLGSYRIEEPCGRGGFATVYRAVHEKLGRAAAIKVLHAQLAHRDDLVERFTREAQTITRIRHPNIVDIYDFGATESGLPYFAMEWLDGRTLAQAIRDRGRFEARDGLRIATEVAAGLSAIHRAGVIHRDLKSNNIVLTESGAGAAAVSQVKLLDFGIAKILSDDQMHLSLPGMMLGTPETMSPEQIRGGDVSPASDVYAFGILLYEMFTGRLPFRADSDREIHRLQLSAARPLVSDLAPVSPGIDAIVQKCMAIEPAERYRDLDDVVAELDKVVPGRMTTHTLPTGSVLAGSYRITEVIGQGGMGTVYAAEHTRLPQRLAIKVISGHLDDGSVARFRREAEIASGLGHANIVRVVDFNTLPDGAPYMVMEYLEGRDLAALIAEGPVALERALDIARQTGSALAAAHACGVVHRDLKPSNIFLSQREIGGEIREHVTILDFGVSKIQDSNTVSTDTRALVGTPQYMAPEQAQGENHRIDGRSDQFALACLLYEMLSGRAAFAGDRLAEIVFKVCYSEPPPLTEIAADVPEQLGIAVQRAMSKNAGDRFADIAEMIAAVTGRPLELLPRDGSLRGGRSSSPPEEPLTPLAAPVPASLELPTAPGRKTPHRTPAPATAATAVERRSPSEVPTAPQNTAAVEPPPAPGLRLGALAIGAVVIAVASAAAAVLLVRDDQPLAAATQPDAGAPGALQLHALDASAERDRPDPPAPDPQTLPLATKAVDGPDETSTGDDGGERDQDDGDSAAADSSSKSRRETGGQSDRVRRIGSATARPRGSSSKAVSAPVAADLNAAESALESGDYDRAQTLVRASMQRELTGRGFAILVKAYCGRGDLGAARDYLVRVPRRYRPSVSRFCEKYQIDLGD